MDTPSLSASGGSLPPRIGGKYRPIRVVGKGGMSVVYEVEHEFTGERLALKVLKEGVSSLDPAMLARFRREARVASLIRSEHVVRVVDADIAVELDGAPYLVMDLLEGADLGDVAGDMSQPPERVVAWLRQIARALDKAHQLGIVHRDLKPENLFLAQHPDGRTMLKILDFGVAKIRSSDEIRRTATGSVVGTPLYMSPEQASGASDRIGPACDIWSLGLIAYRLLTGRDYWRAANVSLLLAQIVYTPIERPSAHGTDLGPEFDTWFLKSCAREPGERFATVSEQVETLAQILGVAPVPPGVEMPSQPTLPRVDTPPTLREQPGAQSIAASVAVARTPPVRTRRATLIALVAFAAAAASVGGLFYLSPRSGAAPSNPSPDESRSVSTTESSARPPVSVPGSVPPAAISVAAVISPPAPVVSAAPSASAPAQQLPETRLRRPSKSVSAKSPSTTPATSAVKEPATATPRAPTHTPDPLADPH